MLILLSLLILFKVFPVRGSSFPLCLLCPSYQYYYHHTVAPAELRNPFDEAAGLVHDRNGPVPVLFSSIAEKS